MNTKGKSTRDAFTFSLGGLSTKSSFFLMPAIADNRIQEQLDEVSRQPQKDQPDTETEMNSFWGRFWLRALRRAV